MNILCALFGHKSREDDYSGGEYMKVVPGTIDGIGRQHARLYAECPRCGWTYCAGAIHVPRNAGVTDPGHHTNAQQTPMAPGGQA